jgi:hypothetical protein
MVSHSLPKRTKKERRKKKKKNGLTSMIFPNTTCFPSSQLVVMVVMKNWDPLVFGPALAMLRYPGPVCFSLKFYFRGRGLKRGKEQKEKREKRKGDSPHPQTSLPR